ncbi:UDP-N-acetylmuramoyl-tripeptide--D-alanyl-D-alanine ligase [Treponema sp.]|uniref:UDP-N-acetylmuramoyl-tripeptide--D-alanyl-D- alanine ligase n=1 Tax=Treponema sp. TaxID=166 RepID=UPI003FA33043
MLLSFEELCHAVSGSVVCHFSLYAGFDSVTTDSRTVVPRSLFVPLRGLQQDGHRYIESALQHGACYVFADEAYLNGEENRRAITALCKQYEASCIRVAHTLTALQNAAAAYLAHFPRLLKIGITGSNGKTTTKELIASIFEQEYRVVKNEGNLNSETGLPLSIFHVSEEHEVGIFELGMNRPGEIAELAAVLKPDIAVITNIGTAHIGMLGSKDAIAHEKKQIFSFFNAECAGFIPADDEYAAFLRDVPQGKILAYGAAADGTYELDGLNGAIIRYRNERIRFPIPGMHNVQNAFAAIAVAEYVRLSPQAIKQGLEQVQSLFGRSQIVYGSVTYLLDCYNANPDSMNAGLSFCAHIPVHGHKIYVLASMRELGLASRAAHRAVCKSAFSSDADALFFFGEEICEAAIEEGRSSDKLFFCFDESNAEKLGNTLDSLLKKHDFVFLKGSRGLALEQFEPILQKERL